MNRRIAALAAAFGLIVGRVAGALLDLSGVLTLMVTATVVALAVVVAVVITTTRRDARLSVAGWRTYQARLAAQAYAQQKAARRRQAAERRRD